MEVGTIPFRAVVYVEVAVACQDRRNLWWECLLALQEADELERLLARVNETVVPVQVHLDRIARHRTPQGRVDAAGADRRDAKLAHLPTGDATSQAPMMNILT